MGAGCCCCSKKNQRISSEYRSIPQYTPIGIKTNDPLILIDGYLDEPILSLEEALEPFYGEINHLSYYIKEAKMQCHYPSEHNLTLDESAAIYIYTMKWNDRCLYDHLQAALNSNDRSTIEPWFAYLKLFKNALDKLPTAKAEVWQGEPFDEELKEQLNSNSLPFYTSLCSCSPSINEIKEYGQTTMGKKIILVGYQSVNGKLVTDYTANDLEEAIVWPGIKLGVSKYVVTDAYHLWILHPVRQIDHSPGSMKNANIASQKHFKCPYKSCDNRCPGNHKTDYCRGFVAPMHSCQHHCIPDQCCDECGQLYSHLYKCNRCEGRYCVECCFK